MTDGDGSAIVELDRRRFVRATGVGVAGLATGGVSIATGEYEASWDDPDEVLRVLYLGGVEDGATHYSEDLLKVITPYLLQRGVEVFYTERQDDLNPETLAHYDAVMLYGNRLEPTEEQIDALVAFVEDGGGFVPVHAASASFTSSDRYVELVGGQFDWHGTGEMTTDRVDHPIFEGVEEIEAWEETYRHTNFNDDIEVLATGEGADYEDDENEPFTWVREQGDGRVFYTAWGHTDDAWEQPGFRQLLENGIRWASGNEDTIGDHPTLDEVPYTHVEEYGHDEVPYYQGDAPDQVSSENDGTWDLVQDPLPISESLTHTITPAEFELEYFVSEDSLPGDLEGSILDMTFDDRGRCWITLTRDYPNDGGEGNDSIVICEDADGDGVADEFTVFADGLSIPHSIVAYGDGVILAEVGTDEAGRVVYLGDEDGDDVADVEEELFAGYGTWDTHAGLNQLYYGHDNWIYGVVGYAGLSTTVGGEDFELGQDLFRFKPDGSELEYVGSGSSNMAGVGTNEEGLVFCSSATASSDVTTYAAIPAAYYDYINNFEGRTTVDIRSPTNFSRTEDDNRILPINDRYRQVDQIDGFTAATDQEIYSAREFPEQYWNSTTFVGEGTGQLMATFYLEQDGAGYESNYHHNLVASNDEWVSPTYANTGPDGMVWMIDFYNFVFQHNPDAEFADPDYELGYGNAYETNKRDNEHSRLYRVTTGDDVDVHGRDLGDASPQELVDALSDDNKFWRLTAQRKLVERGETDVVAALVDLVTDENLDEIGLDPGAIHALWTLHGLGALEDGEDASGLVHADPDDLDHVPDDVDHVIFCEDEVDVSAAAREALSHSSAGVRLNALRVLPGDGDTRDAILEHGVLEDDDWRVAMWAFLALATTPESDAAGTAVFEAIDDEDRLGDDLLADAASVAAATHAQGFIDAYLDEYGDPDDQDDDQVEDVDVMPNGDFEQFEAAGPAEWQTEIFGGDAEFIYTDEEAYSGELSIAISSEGGTDAGWQMFDVPVEPDTDYTLSAMVKTEDVTTGDPPGWAVDGYDAPYGACLNVEELANGEGLGAEGVTDDVTGTEDWTEVTLEFNSMGYEELQINAVFGAYQSDATGTAWFDDISVVGPDGEDVMINGDVEEGESEPSPIEWYPREFGGSAEHAFTDEEADSGDYSVRIDSEEGADAAWSVDVDVEPETEYTLVGRIKTENVGDLTGDAEGAWFNIEPHHETTDSVSGTEDWTEVSYTFDSGDNEEITINALFGGYGTATGTAWWDDVRLYGPGEQAEAPNILTNPSFEEMDGDEPVGWETNTWGGSPEFSVDDAEAHGGEYSARIDSEDGADASWSQEFDVEPNTDYEVTFRVKTEELDDGDSYGALINLHELQESYLPDPVTGTEDWTERSFVFNSEGNDSLLFNLLFGGWGDATGTAWWDHVAVRSLGDVGEGIEQIYGRVQRHLEDVDGGGDDVPSDVLDPAETIELGGQREAWQGLAPESVEDEENPTLRLLEGEEYTVEWTNLDGMIHNFEILDADREVLAGTDFVDEEGEGAAVDFTATAEMIEYQCQPHPDTMAGDVEVVEE